MSFNSSMVRLELKNNKQTLFIRSRFNSSMVRLEPEDDLDAILRVLFQFQYGAIRTQNITYLHCFASGFNSSMVRLEQLLTNAARRLELFQFQYGAIRTL